MTIKTEVQAAILNNFPQWPDHLPYGGVHPDDTLYTFKAAVEYYTLAPVLSLIYQPGPPTMQPRKLP